MNQRYMRNGVTEAHEAGQRMNELGTIVIFD